MKFHYKWSNLPPELKTILPIDLKHLPTGEQLRIEKTRVGFIARVELGKPLYEAALLADCSSSELTRRFYRYATVDDTGEIGGWKNVTSFARLGDYTRSEESAAGATSRNAMGMFSRILNRNEDLHEKLIELIEARVGDDGRRNCKKVKKQIAEEFTLWRAENVLDEPSGRRFVRHLVRQEL